MCCIFVGVVVYADDVADVGDVADGDDGNGDDDVADVVVRMNWGIQL